MDYFGDKNLHYFHVSTIVYRRRNRVEALKHDNGEWTLELEALKRMAIQFHSRLLRESKVVWCPFPLTGCFPKLDAIDISHIHRWCTNMEIKNIVFSMGVLKAPKSNGLHALMFLELATCSEWVDL